MTPQSRHSRPSARPASASAESAGAHPRPLRVLDEVPARRARRHNLPHVPSSFVGREHDIASVTELLAEARLVTLTGVGGMGKTRLAIQVAMDVEHHFADGAWFVELAAVSEPAGLPAAVGSVLPSSPRHGEHRSAEQLANDIGDQRLLLVLDNCEHLAEPCGYLVDVILRSCPGLSVLVTSREALRVGGEHRWSVGPLSLPDGEQMPVAAVKASDAGTLFVQRAKASSPGFRLTETTAAQVAEICTRLDGMPLAIELAAERLASLSVNDVLGRLDDRFGLLTTGSRAVMPRHQTLAATLEWSYELLSPAEATVLRRVSVFVDWSLDAAQDVCSGNGVNEIDVVDHLAALTNKSLVVVDTADAEVRYHLLESVRAWARTELDAAGETDEIHARFAAYCVDVAERAADGLGSTQAHAWLDLLDAENDNLRAALEWARTVASSELGARLALALASYWRTRGSLREGLSWLEWALTASADCPPLLRAKLLRETGLWRGMLGDITAALPLVEESSALFAKAGDHDASICACDSMFHMFSNPRQSLFGLEKEIDRCRQTGDGNKLAHFLWALGQAHFLLGELGDARRHFEECIEFGRQETDSEALRSGLLGLGRVLVLLGDAPAAEAAFKEAQAKAEGTADPDEVATALGLLGDLARAQGDRDRARELIAESMRLTKVEETRVGVARAVYFEARLAQAESTSGDNGAGELFARALALAGEADGLGFHNARCLLGLGWAADANGDRSAAVARFLEALATAQAIGDNHAIAQAHDHLSVHARLDGRTDEADTLARRGLELHQQIGDVAGIAASLESVAGLAVDAERWPVAARLFAAAESILEMAGYCRSSTEQARRDRDLERVRDEMAENFVPTWDEGAGLSATEACAYATRGRGSRDRPSNGWDSLTPAEREVVSLVGEGLSNPEVGRRLFVSPRTVGHHLAHVYQKLGIHSRGALIKELAELEPE